MPDRQARSLEEILQFVAEHGCPPGGAAVDAQGPPRPKRTLIGYWHAGADPYSHPQVLVDPGWEAGRRDAIVGYLRSGATCGMYLGWSYCRFGCYDQNGGRELCDDRWCWPSGLAHYVEHHLIRLPDEFVAHAAAREFQPVTDVERDLESFDGRPDTSFWERWSREHAPFRPEAHCHTCTPPPTAAAAWHLTLNQSFGQCGDHVIDPDADVRDWMRRLLD